MSDPLALLTTQRDNLRAELWQKGKLRYKLYPLQREIYARIREANAPWTLLECGRGFSKSYLMTLMAIEDCIRNPQFPVAIIGPEIKQQVRIISQTMAKICADAPPEFVQRRRSDAEWSVGGNTLFIAGFNRESIERLRGLRLGSAYLDEARDCDQEDFLYGLHDVLIPTLAHASGRTTVGTSTPEPLDHPIITWVAPQAERHGTHFVYTVDDNPTLSASQKAQMIDAMGGLESDAVQRELYCKRIRPRTQVVLPDYVSLWDEQTKHRDYGNWLVFGDIGGVRDKTWLGVGYYDMPTASLYVIAEALHDANTASATINESIGRLRNLAPENADVSFCIDMPGQMLVDFRALHNLHIKPPVKPEFHQSINRLNMGFRSKRIHIAPECRILRTCCEYGLLNKQRTDFERSNQFGHCDPIAGLKYGWLASDQTTNRWPVPRNTMIPPHMRKQEPSQTLSNLFAGKR